MTIFRHEYQSKASNIMDKNQSLSSVRSTLKGWTILIVDDQPDNLMIAKVALEFRGATISIASNGEEGLLLLHEHLPTVILLDLSMPKMDGWEMLRHIRSLPEMAKLPVIALTAHAMGGDREKAMKAGFDGYISKPFDVMTLPIQIQQVISERFVANQAPAS